MKIWKKIKENEDWQGIALGFGTLLGWPVLWLLVLFVCAVVAVAAGWILSIM